MKRALLLAALLLALAQPAPAGLGDGLAAYYDFETNLQDKSGNGRHIALSFGNPEPAWAGGTVTRAGSSSVRHTLRVGKALNLVDADGDYVKAPLGSGAATTAAGTFNLGGNFTISAWHNLAPLPSNTSTRYFVFEAEAGFDVSWGTSSGDHYVSFVGEISAASATLSRNAWHHVVHVFEASGTAVMLTTYIDGVRLGQTQASASAVNFARLVLGNSRDGQDRKWDGLLDEVAVWNRALTSAELDELHARGLSGFGVTEDLATRGAAYLSLSSTQTIRGTVTGGGIYNLGAQVAVTTHPATGYRFDAWSGAFTGQPASFSHTVTQSLTAAASFVRDHGDTDGDGLSNYDELAIHGTNPSLADTDSDGLSDRFEIETTSTSPTQSDAAFVHQAIAAFGPAATGAIALTGPTISAEAGETVLLLGVAGFGAGLPWMSLPIAPAGVVLLPGGELRVKVPAPSATSAIHEIRGKIF